MRLAPASLVASIALLLAATGCARTLYIEAETVAGAPDGRYWIAGSECFAAYSSGGALVRRDYPRVNGAPDYAYEPYMTRVAHLLHAGGQTFLFTRHGDALLFEGAAWARLPTDLRAVIGAEDIQIDNAVLAPDGRIVLHIHDNKIIWAGPNERFRRDVEIERLPQYFTWVGFVEGTLYGLGWDGNRRALKRRAGFEQWVSAALPPELDSATLHGVVRLPSGAVAVVSGRGFIVPDEGKGAQTIPLPGPALQRPAAQIADPQSSAPARPVFAGFGLTSAPPPSGDPPAGGQPARPGALQVAGPPDSPQGTSVAAQNEPLKAEPTAWVIRALEIQGRAPVLVVSGSRSGFIDMAEKELVFKPCAQASDVAAAIPIPGRSGSLRLITRSAALLELVNSECRPVAPPLIQPKD